MNLKKFLAVFSAVIMLFGLLACGKKEKQPTEVPVDGQEVTETPVQAVGAILLAGDNRLTLHYDADGKIVAIANREDIACYSQLFGETCADAAVTILKDSETPLASKFLLVRQTAGSLNPMENFLQAVYEQIAKVVKDIPVILCVAEDLREQGYFSSDIALAILDAYLDRPDNVSYTSSDAPEDGYYHITVHTGNTTEYYTVGALYGSVTPQTEFPDDEYVGTDLDSFTETDWPVEDFAESTEE